MQGRLHNAAFVVTAHHIADVGDILTQRDFDQHFTKLDALHGDEIYFDYDTWEWKVQVQVDRDPVVIPGRLVEPVRQGMQPIRFTYPFYTYEPVEDRKVYVLGELPKKKLLLDPDEIYMRGKNGVVYHLQRNEESGEMESVMVCEEGDIDNFDDYVEYNPGLPEWMEIRSHGTWLGDKSEDPKTKNPKRFKKTAHRAIGPFELPGELRKKCLDEFKSLQYLDGPAQGLANLEAFLRHGRFFVQESEHDPGEYIGALHTRMYATMSELKRFLRDDRTTESRAKVDMEDYDYDVYVDYPAVLPYYAYFMEFSVTDEEEDDEEVDDCPVEGWDWLTEFVEYQLSVVRRYEDVQEYLEK